MKNSHMLMMIVCLAGLLLASFLGYAGGWLGALLMVGCCALPMLVGRSGSSHSCGGGDDEDTSKK